MHSVTTSYMTFIITGIGKHNQEKRGNIRLALHIKMTSYQFSILKQLLKLNQYSIINKGRQYGKNYTQNIQFIMHFI